jgi:hypothetical protein
LFNEDDKLDDSELITDDALLLSDEATDPRSLERDEDTELAADDALLLSDDALELKSLDRLPPELLLFLELLLEHAGTPKRTTAATSAPAIGGRIRRTMREV